MCNTSHHEVIFENKGRNLPCQKVMLSFRQKHLTSLIVKWKSEGLDRVICNHRQCFCSTSLDLVYFIFSLLSGGDCVLWLWPCTFPFFFSGGLSCSCFSASSEYNLQPKKYDFLLLKWVKPFWFFNHKQWSSEKNPEEYGLQSLCGFWCETGLSNASSSLSVVKEKSKVS